MTLELKNIVKTYDNKKRVLDEINIVFSSGVYGLLGPNGAGKTTMIRIMCGVETVTSGEVLFNGKPISEITTGDNFRRTLGYVPQKCGYYPNFNAKEFLEYMAVIKGISQNKANERINKALELVRLTDTGNKKIKNFSGGMKQRLIIAQSILNNPGILILDEPTVGLDLEERMKFKQFVSDYASNNIVIFATHIVSDIEDIGSEIIMLKTGVIVARGSLKDLIAPIAGKVWVYTCSKYEATELKKKYRVSNSKVVADAFELRIISDKQPAHGAYLVENNLQDLYLYLFEKEG